MRPWKKKKNGWKNKNNAKGKRNKISKCANRGKSTQKE
jgi:hypothetical protein